MPNRDCDSLKRELVRLRASGEKWKVIGKKYPGVALGTLCRICKDGYEPKRADIRHALGLIEYSPAPVCRVHGIAHGKQCRPRKTFERNAADYSAWLTANAGELARRVEWAETTAKSE